VAFAVSLGCDPPVPREAAIEAKDTPAVVDAPAPLRTPPAPRAQRAKPDLLPVDGDAPNVVLIVVDTMRTDVTSLFPDGYDATPFLAELAEKGVVFRNAYSTSSWTVPAMYSLMTGLYPSQHGMTAGYFAGEKVVDQAVLPQAAYTLAEQLRDLEYDTFGVCTNQHLAAKYGMGQGFDRYVGDTFLKLPFPDLAVESLAPEILASPRYFLWLHYFDPHHPYGANLPWFDEWNRSGFADFQAISLDALSRFYRGRHGLGPEDQLPVNVLVPLMRRAVAIRWGHPKNFFASMPPGDGPPAAGTTEARYLDFLKAAYASEVRKADESIRSVAGELRFDDDDLVIVVSDHGEELMEHGEIGHRWLGSVSQELIRVPLLIKFPGNRGAGRVIDAPVSLVDLVPTIRAALGQPPMEELPGTDLAALLERGAAADREIYCELAEGGARLHCAIAYPWKLVQNETSGTARLYDLSRDPGEDDDVSAEHPDVVERLKEALSASDAKGAAQWPTPGSASVSADELSRLRSLGYVD
jgi:arylsulfatase A-like enzyme